MQVNFPFCPINCVYTQTQCITTFVTGSKVYVPWEGLRLALRTPRGSWLLTRTDSTAFPIVCLGPRVRSKRPWELPSLNVMLCLTYTGIATRLKIKQAKTKQVSVVWANIHRNVFFICCNHLILLHCTVYWYKLDKEHMDNTASASVWVTWSDPEWNSLTSESWHGRRATGSFHLGGWRRGSAQLPSAWTEHMGESWHHPAA